MCVTGKLCYLPFCLYPKLGPFCVFRGEWVVPNFAGGQGYIEKLSYFLTVANGGGGTKQGNFPSSGPTPTHHLPVMEKKESKGRVGPIAQIF